MAEAPIPAAGFPRFGIGWQLQLDHGRASKKGDELQELFTDRIDRFCLEPDWLTDQPDGLQAFGQHICSDCRALRVCRMKQQFMSGQGCIPGNCERTILLRVRSVMDIAVPVPEHPP